MKITVFQSEKGDCLLLKTAKGAHVLVDGGMASTYRQFVAPALGKLRKQGQKLDLVYVSHIDEDHIAGILALVDDLVTWRAFDYQQSKGNTRFRKPTVPRPPEIGGIWHNAFSELLKNNAGPVENLLAQTSGLLSLAGPTLTAMAINQHELATSVKQAIQLSQRISAKQLNIPLNAAFDGQLGMVRSPIGHIATIGGMRLSVIGPFAADLAKLRDDWNTWLRDNRDAVKKLVAKARQDTEKLGVEAAAVALSDIILSTAGLGDRSKVTPPNLASLMLLAEEGSKTVLLTGDGHADDILAGLAHHQRFDANDQLHLNVLKVQHHGSEHNMTDEFCTRVTADNYVFCGNGKHENPDLRVVDLICSTRLKATNRHRFKLWFNCSAAAAPSGGPRQHMRQVEALVERFRVQGGKTLQAEFLDQPSLSFNV